MDKQIDKAITEFWSDLRGITTEEFYNEYLRWCEIDNVEPRPKSVVIREACRVSDFPLKIVVKRKIIKTFEARVKE